MGLLARRKGSQGRSRAAIREALERRLRQEQQLRQAEDVIASVLETIPVGVVVRDRFGRLLASNPAAERLLGQKPRDADHSGVIDVYELTGPDGALLSEDALPNIRALRGERTAPARFEVYNPVLGRRVPIVVSAAPLGSLPSVWGCVVVIAAAADS